MKHKAQRISIAISICALAGVMAGQEKKITRADLPAAVEKTVTQESKGATIRGFSRETEDGQTLYEAELTISGRSRDISMDANGAIVEVEDQVAISALPAAVRDALLAKVGPGKVQTVESLTKHGKLVAYEAKVMTGGKRSEIQVGPDGKPLDHEE